MLSRFLLRWFLPGVVATAFAHAWSWSGRLPVRVGTWLGQRTREGRDAKRLFVSLLSLVEAETALSPAQQPCSFCPAAACSPGLGWLEGNHRSFLERTGRIDGVAGGRSLRRRIAFLRWAGHMAWRFGGRGEFFRCCKHHGGVGVPRGHLFDACTRTLTTAVVPARAIGSQTRSSVLLNERSLRRAAVAHWSSSGFARFCSFGVWLLSSGCRSFVIWRPVLYSCRVRSDMRRARGAGVGFLRHGRNFGRLASSLLLFAASPSLSYPLFVPSVWDGVRFSKGFALPVPARRV